MVMVVVRHEYDDGDGCYSTFKCKINVDDGAIVTIMIVICVAIYLNHIYIYIIWAQAVSPWGSRALPSRVMAVGSRAFVALGAMDSHRRAHASLRWRTRTETGPSRIHECSQVGYTRDLLEPCDVIAA